jgi:hypothetical protein
VRSGFFGGAGWYRIRSARKARRNLPRTHQHIAQIARAVGAETSKVVRRIKEKTLFTATSGSCFSLVLCFVFPLSTVFWSIWPCGLGPAALSSVCPQGCARAQTWDLPPPPGLERSSVIREGALAAGSFEALLGTFGGGAAVDSPLPVSTPTPSGNGRGGWSREVVKEEPLHEGRRGLLSAHIGVPWCGRA